MGAVTSLCQRRSSDHGTLTELGISDEYEWDGLEEDRIEAYYEAKDKMMQELQEKVGDDAVLGSDWMTKLQEEAQEMLKMLLVRRAIALVHVLKPIEEQRKGMRWLHSQGAMSPGRWNSYQHAEEQCAAELQALNKESQELTPGTPPNSLIRFAVNCYNSHGMSWPERKEEFAVHPEAREVSTVQVNVELNRESGESLGLSLQQSPPKELRSEGQESHLVIGKILPDGFCHKRNESESEPMKRVQVGDRIMAVVDGSVPEKERKPVGGDADKMFEIITKEQNKSTPLFFIILRPMGPPLRFKIGQRVKAHYGEQGWLPGRVVKVWEQQPNGSRAPYVIRLDDGQIVMAPQDSDACVSLVDPGEESQGKDASDQWARGMFKSPDGSQEEGATPSQQSEKQGPRIVQLQFLLKRDPGERLGLALNHDPPLEARPEGETVKSCLLVTNVIEGGYVHKFNQQQEHPAQRLQAGDRIVAIVNAGLPEDEREPVGEDSQAMLQVITHSNNGSTPLVFLVIRALVPEVRFAPGQRVLANVNNEWQPGVVVKLWEQGKPYVIRLESNQMVMAPRDHDDCVRKADARFKVGDTVMVNHEGVFKRCGIVQVGGDKGEYEVQLEGDDEKVWVPADTNQILRPIARFQVGDQVQARVESGYETGTVEAVYHPMWVYSIRIDDKLVYAPEDTDTFVKSV